jgi:hypothetical protein
MFLEILSFSTPTHKPRYVFQAKTNTNAWERESQVRLYTKPTRFELEYNMIALVFLDSKLQVEEKIIDR